MFHPNSSAKVGIFIALMFFVGLGIAFAETAEEALKKGMEYYDSWNNEEAMPAFTRAIELDPNYAEAYYHRGRAYDWENLTGKEGALDKAISDYGKAIEINPNYVNAYLYRGIDYTEAGNNDKAINDFTKAIELDSNNSDVYYQRGMIYGDQGNSDEAISDFTKAIELNPKFDSAYQFRGVEHERKGNFEQALSDLNKAIELENYPVTSLFSRAGFYYNRGDYDKAWQDVHTLEELGAGILITTLAPTFLPDLKKASYTKAIEIDPKNADGYNGLAWLMATCPDDSYRDGKRAVELAEKAAALKDDANILDTLAAAYAEAGKFQDAIKTQESAITKLRQESETEDLSGYEERLSSYKAGNPWREE